MQISKQELGIEAALEWNLCLPATPSFWLTQLIVQALVAVEDDITLSRQLLDVSDFVTAAQYMDIMILFASHVPYRFIAAIAFCITCPHLMSSSETDW